MRHPKIPVFQERRGALAPGSCPSSYCVEPIILWDPFTFFPDFKTRKACRHCNSTSIVDNWWTDGKCVEGIESTYRKFAKRMKCNACGKASQSDDDFTIEKFPRFVRTFYSPSTSCTAELLHTSMECHGRRAAPSDISLVLKRAYRAFQS